MTIAANFCMVESGFGDAARPLVPLPLETVGSRGVRSDTAAMVDREEDGGGKRRVWVL